MHVAHKVDALGRILKRYVQRGPAGDLYREIVNQHCTGAPSRARAQMQAPISSAQCSIDARLFIETLVLSPCLKCRLLLSEITCM